MKVCSSSRNKLRFVNKTSIFFDLLCNWITHVLCFREHALKFVISKLVRTKNPTYKRQNFFLGVCIYYHQYHTIQKLFFWRLFYWRLLLNAFFGHPFWTSLMCPLWASLFFTSLLSLTVGCNSLLKVIFRLNIWTSYFDVTFGCHFWTLLWDINFEHYFETLLLNITLKHHFWMSLLDQIFW